MLVGIALATKVAVKNKGFFGHRKIGNRKNFLILISNFQIIFRIFAAGFLKK